MNPTWKAVLGITIIFLLGCLFGGMGTALFLQQRTIATLRGGPSAIATALERRTTRGLSLDSEQRKQIHSLLVEYLRQRAELQKQLRPQVKELNKNTLTQIDAVLNPDQQARFEGNLATIQDRFGHNPFSVAGDDPTPRSSAPDTIGTDTNAPAPNR
jgi:hypothetical protein